MKLKISLGRNYSYLYALIVMMIGFAAGYAVRSQTYKPTGQTAVPISAYAIEHAKNEIAALYKDKAVKACWTVNYGSDMGAGKYELTYRNIQINNQVNRAILTDCAENSMLLSKNKNGEWVATTVNITNFNRVNPVWQKACHIEGITVADDTVRPENQSIDQMNLEECRKLDEQ